MSFLETPRFPDAIAYGSQGGPQWSTTVIETKSGQTISNQNWSYPLHVFDIQPGVKETADWESLLNFFMALAGRANNFRFKHFGDWKSCSLLSDPSDTDQTIGTGDASETDFQLIKTYTAGALSATRLIQKPVSGTVLVAVAGTPQTGGGIDYTIDTTTGIITFEAGSIPGIGEAVTAGYEFDVPCKFGSDWLNAAIISKAFSGGGIVSSPDSIPVREIRIPL